MRGWISAVALIVSVSGAIAEPLPRCVLATNTQLLCPLSVEIAADLYYQLSLVDPEVARPYSQRTVKEAGCIVTHHRPGYQVPMSRLGSHRVIEPDGSIRVLVLHLYHGTSYAVPDPILKGTCPRYLNGPGSVSRGGETISDAPPELYPTDTSQVFCAEARFEPLVRKGMARPDDISDRDFLRAAHDGHCYVAEHRYPIDQAP